MLFSKCKNASTPVPSSHLRIADSVHEHPKGVRGGHSQFAARSLPLGVLGKLGTWVACQLGHLGSAGLIGRRRNPKPPNPFTPHTQPTTVAVCMHSRFRRRRRAWLSYRLPRYGHKQSALLLQITKGVGDPGPGREKATRRIVVRPKPGVWGERFWGRASDAHRLRPPSQRLPLISHCLTLTLAPALEV